MSRLKEDDEKRMFVLIWAVKRIDSLLLKGEDVHLQVMHCTLDSIVRSGEEGMCSQYFYKIKIF